jgi:hypothetical protein
VEDVPGLVGDHGLLDPEPLGTDRLPLRPRYTLRRHATCIDGLSGKQRQPLGSTRAPTGVAARIRTGGDWGGGWDGVGGRGRRGRGWRPAAAASAASWEEARRPGRVSAPSHRSSGERRAIATRRRRRSLIRTLAAVGEGG